MKDIRYWIQLIYKIFLTYDTHNRNFKDEDSQADVHSSISSDKASESKPTRKKAKSAVSNRASSRSKRV